MSSLNAKAFYIFLLGFSRRDGSAVDGVNAEVE